MVAVTAVFYTLESQALIRHDISLITNGGELEPELCHIVLLLPKHNTGKSVSHSQ